MSYHHKKLFSVNYKIQSISVSRAPIINHQVNGIQQKNDKELVSLVLNTPPKITNVVMIFELPYYQVEELEKIYKEDRYLVLSFNKIEEEE